VDAGCCSSAMKGGPHARVVQQPAANEASQVGLDRTRGNKGGTGSAMALQSSARLWRAGVVQETSSGLKLETRVALWC
jgi:hypothetical protein